MARNTQKTLLGHGIALLLKDRELTTGTEPLAFGSWVKGAYTLALGSIETYNQVTGTFTATLTTGVPAANTYGNAFAVAGTLEPTTGASLQPGTRAKHVSGTHTLTGDIEAPIYATYLGAPVLTSSDPAWHEILPGDALFTTGASSPLTATHVYEAGVTATKPTGDPYVFIDGAISDDMTKAAHDAGTALWAEYGLIGTLGDTIACDAPTGEAITQFVKMLPNYPLRALEYGLTSLEPRNLPDICHNKLINTAAIEALLTTTPDKETHIAALTILTEITLNLLTQAEQEIPKTREQLEVLHKHLKASSLYNEETAQEIKRDYTN